MLPQKMPHKVRIHITQFDHGMVCDGEKDGKSERLNHWYPHNRKMKMECKDT